MINKISKSPKGYLYCKECDIFYPEKYKREADAKRKKNEKKEIALRRLADLMIRDCPFCAFKETTSFVSAVMSFSQPRRTRFFRLPGIKVSKRLKRCILKTTKN